MRNSRILKQFTLALAIAGLCGIGAAQNENATGNSTMGSENGSQSSGMGSTDKTFVKKAAQGGLAEVELGRLATERAASPDVKKFGQRMVDDHSKANDQLK